MKLFRAFFIALVFSFSGCADDKILDRGVIVKLAYSPAHTYTTTTYVMVNKVMVPITNTHYAPDEWTATIRGVFGTDTIYNEIQISQAEYNSFQYGDTITIYK
jgi:hypothetical protein